MAQFDLVLINLNTRTQIKISQVSDTLVDSYSPNIDEESIVGRSQPILSYSGGTIKSISYSVTVHEDYIEGKYDGDIRKLCAEVRALSYPLYSVGVIPPKSYVRIGDMYEFWGVVSSTITYSPPIRNGRYILAKIDFTFTCLGNYSSNNVSLIDNVVSAEDVENGTFYAKV